MGYCYDAGGKLCCDVCDHSGGVRKYRCPFGYCPAIALCPKCHAEHPEYTSKAGHRAHGCEKYALEFEAHEREHQALLDSNQFVRCAALWHPERPEPNVKVFFRGKAGEIAFWMSQKTYDSIPIGVNAVPSDFRKYGKLEKTESLDTYDAELEAVPA